MKLGLFSYSCHLAFGKHEVFSPKKPINIFDYMDYCKELNLDGIQIDICHLESREDNYLESIRKYADEKGFYIEYGSTGINSLHTSAELDVAFKLGAKLMRTFMGFNRYLAETNTVAEVAKAVSVLKEVDSKARKLGIKIALENHCDATTDELVNIMKRIDSDNVGVCVDLGNFMIHQEEPLESVKKLAPYIINTHFKDYKMEMMNWGFKSYGVPLGEGVIDLKGILDVLKNQCKLDRIMLEIPVEKASTEEKSIQKEKLYVNKSVDYARSVLEIK